MSNKVAVISPARNEKYLPQTVQSALDNARGEVEFVAVLEGYTPEDWPALQAKYPNLHTIYHATPKGMRPAINAAAASAISRGTKYLMKLDAHCMVPEGFDIELKSNIDADWVVVPRRKRLEPATWTLQDVGKPDIDYHYLSFPDDPQDFGGPGLNGKVWYERCRERADIDFDDEMSSQGSGWFMHADYFQQLELMDQASYGTFWNEFQEIGLKCWLSGGQVKVNKRTWYAHWHKGKAGRGYSLDHALLKQGRDWTMKWLYNEAWPKQTRPIKWLIEHFWPVPTWPENWESLVYGTTSKGSLVNVVDTVRGSDDGTSLHSGSSLTIHSACYGIGQGDDIDVRETLQAKVANNSLDLMVTNSDLGVGNPFRGQKKRLSVVYSYNGGNQMIKNVDERDWLIIGQSERYIKLDPVPVADTPAQDAVAHVAPLDAVVEAPDGGVGEQSSATVDLVQVIEPAPIQDNMGEVMPQSPQLMVFESQSGVRKVVQTYSSAPSLNDFLIHRFNIPAHRLRGPMPIEVPSFHRDNLAQLFAELGFNHGAEIGVAEGKYSEVLLKANPDLQLMLVDPWGRYDGNAQQKTDAKHEFALKETQRRIEGTKAKLYRMTSMEAVRGVKDASLDFVYIDANHSFDYVMQDLIHWSSKVRVGGIIAGDDFYYLDPKRWGAGPVEAVMAYTQAHKIAPWFIFNAHRSVDFMWVNQ